MGGCCAGMVALANMGKGVQADAGPCRPELPALQNSSTQGRSARAATHSCHLPRAAAISACYFHPPALPRRDYNQRHFVRNEAFQQAADKLQGPTRRVFIEFLERACTAGRWVVVAWECMAGSQVLVRVSAGAARLPLQVQLASTRVPQRHPLPPSPPAQSAEFSGFLMYKELGRRLQEGNPVVAELFSLLARDEARHAGFTNKALSGE